jgi:hypothetical protein
MAFSLTVELVCDIFGMPSHPDERSDEFAKASQPSKAPCPIFFTVWGTVKFVKELQ